MGLPSRRLGEGVDAEQKRHAGKSLFADHAQLDHRSVIQRAAATTPVWQRTF
jgi:hypothetical protein